MFKLIVYSISIISLSYVASIIYKDLNKASLKTRFFFYLAVFMELWVGILAIADFTSSYSVALLGVNLAVFFIEGASWSFLFFALSYLKDFKNKIVYYFASVLMLATLYLGLTEKLIYSVNLDIYGAGIDKISNLYLPIVVGIDFLIIFGIFYLLTIKKKVSKIVKTQINIITFATIIDLIGNLFGNEVSQYFPSLKYLIQVSTIANALFVVLIAYTIIKHKFLDIREAAARSVTYLFTLSAVLLLYAVPLVLLIRYVLNVHLSIANISIFVLATFIIGASFQPIKFFFNRLSNRIFFRDFFEPQAELDKLGNLLVGNIKLTEILEGSKKLISEAIKPNKIDYLINSLEETIDKKELIRLLDKSDLYLINIEGNTKNVDLNLIKNMEKNGYVISIKLRTNDQNLGYLLLGYRKSGNLYSFNDIRFLTIATDEIAISLQNAINYVQIEQFNQKLKNDIDEATSKLKSANSKLRLEDQNKDDFISMASHQLRTPLTSVKGYISMLLDEDAGKINKTQREMLDQAFYASSKMVYLIADLLNISRLKSGKFVITPSQINLNEIVSQEIDQLKDNAKSHQIKINFTKSKEFPDVSMDETKTRQVIMNFLDNAIYYTPPGGNIEVKLAHDDTSIELKVIDSGMGVPRQDQHHLFTKFYRGSNAKKIRPDGTGIGLYMAKKIILAQGGVVTFSSTLGKGSTFGFKISKKGYTV